jgi:hypothetical protein
MPIEIAESRSVSGSPAPAAAGIPFGSTRAMLSYTPRQRDRRQAVPDLLAALARGLDLRLDVSLMRSAFETALGRVVPVRSVHLREIGSRW